jgi:hypothetical protein
MVRDVDHRLPLSVTRRIAVMRHEATGWRVKSKIRVALELGITMRELEGVREWIRNGPVREMVAK